MELEKGYVLLIWDKSGIAFNGGIKTMGGVFDAGYRGEILIVLINLGKNSYKIEKGQKIAQLIIQKVETAKIEVVNKLSDDGLRGEGNFGSTGLYAK